MDTSSTPVRRDIRFLSKAERQRYFFCLKFLSVLPPLQPGNNRKFNVAWKVENGQRYFKNVIPLNIHDEFISSHQTCCEHGTIYFHYYHRHLMICLEIALNLAEEILVEGKQRIPSNLYNSNAAYFDAVFSRYKKIVSDRRSELGLPNNADLPQISAHYWNPLDYTTDISIPQQLQKRIPDEMDNLYFAVNSHYAWSFNFATRWFKNASGAPRIPVNFQTMGFFSAQPVAYSPDQQKIVYGDLNPRSTAATDFFGIDRVDRYGIAEISNTASDINLYKNFVKFEESGSTIDVCTLDQSEINTLFGSMKKNLHWLSKKQRSALSPQNSINAYTYNKSLPHFQFAYSLFKKSNVFIKDYVTTQSLNPENSIEKAHNTMHNSLMIFMSDSQISITNPLFFLYHSWIDYQLQVKIRMIRANPSISKTQYNYTKTYLETRIKPFSVLDQVSGQSIKYGDYYIFEWANPQTRFYPQFNQPLTPTDYEAAFKSKNFIINDTQKGIRRSDQLNSFYKSQYLPKNGHKYAQYKNFSKFSFSYNYEIYDYDGNKKPYPVLMKDNVVAIPSYINDIYLDYNEDWNQNKIGIGSTLPKLNSFENEDQKDFYMKKNLEKAIRMSIGGYATYSSSIKSTVIPIDFKITQKGIEKLSLSEESLAILKRGLVITTASLLTRGVGSQICPNCKDQKQFFIFGSEKLAEISQNLYCDISRNITQKLYSKVVNGKKIDIQNYKITELFELKTPRPVFNRLELIEGARQVDFIVKFKGKQVFSNSHVTLTLYSYSVQEKKLEQVVIRKKQSLNGNEFQFPRLLGVSSNKYHFDYVYRHVEGIIVNGQQMQDFSFDISMRYRLITFQILVEQKIHGEEKYLDIEVVDRDYDFKLSHFGVQENLQIEA